MRGHNKRTRNSSTTNECVTNAYTRWSHVYINAKPVYTVRTRKEVQLQVEP